MERLNHFEYHRPGSLEEAVDLLTRFGDKARLLAGGTDLLIQMKHRLASPGHVVALKWISKLTEIAVGDTVRIGAMATYTQLLKSPVIAARFPILVDAFSNLGTHQIRNVATLGGNLCNAAPSADSAPALLALNATLSLVSSQGKREIDLDGFFLAPGRTVIKPREILASILLPMPSPYSNGAYIKHTRRAALDLPIVGVAAQCTFSPDLKNIAEARIGLGVAAPTPMRPKAAEAFLKGKAVTEEILDEAGSMACREAKPRDTWRGTAFYRSEMIKVLIKEAVLRARERAAQIQKKV